MPVPAHDLLSRLPMLLSPFIYQQHKIRSTPVTRNHTSTTINTTTPSTYIHFPAIHLHTTPTIHTMTITRTIMLTPSISFPITSWCHKPDRRIST